MGLVGKRLNERFNQWLSHSESAQLPKLKLVELPDGFELDTELVDVDIENISIAVDGCVLTVKVFLADMQHDELLYSQTFYLDHAIAANEIEASFESHWLHLWLPKFAKLAPDHHRHYFH